MGVSVDRGRWSVQYTEASLEEHEKNDEVRFFSRWGTELFAAFRPAEAWQLLGGFNFLTPEDEHPGEYRIAYGLVRADYSFVNDSAVFVEVKLEGSRNSAGDGSRPTIYGVGMRLNF